MIIIKLKKMIIMLLKKIKKTKLRSKKLQILIKTKKKIISIIKIL